MGRVQKNDLILLNLTGGGYARIKRDMPCLPVAPDLAVTPDDLNNSSKIADFLKSLRP